MRKLDTFIVCVGLLVVSTLSSPSMGQSASAPAGILGNVNVVNTPNVNVTNTTENPVPVKDVNSEPREMIILKGPVS